MLRKAFERLIDALREACVARYGERLLSLVVYGSVELARAAISPDEA